ncbi:hypothetical protein JCM6882_003220 [Rhodosporidiobolus microsporus]
MADIAQLATLFSATTAATASLHTAATSFSTNSTSPTSSSFTSTSTRTPDRGSSDPLPLALSAFAYSCLAVVILAFVGSYGMCWYRIRESNVAAAILF